MHTWSWDNFTSKKEILFCVFTNKVLCTLNLYSRAHLMVSFTIFNTTKITNVELRKIFVEKTMSYVILGNNRLCRFLTRKKTKNCYDATLIFWSFATFFVLTIFWSGAKQRFCFRDSMSVLDQNGRIQALGFLARWQLTSQALYYKIP